MSDTEEIELYLVAESPAAYLFSESANGGTKSFWVPISLVNYIRKEPEKMGA